MKRPPGRILAMCLAVSAGLPVPAGAGQPNQSPIEATLKFPARHPYLAVTPEGLQRAKERAARHPWARQILEGLIEDARKKAARALDKLPAKGDQAHWQVGAGLLQVGLGYAFSGDRQLAMWVRDGLVAYADLYPTLPWTNRRCRVFSQSSLYEAIWVESIVQAYDLVADSGVFSKQDRQHVEQDLLRASAECFLIRDFQHDPRIRDLHYRCYNFQAWHLGAIGLAGLALRDAEMVDYALNSRYGLKHLLAHDVRDDGLFWERSVGYHHFVIQALLPWTEAMHHCGVDLYGLQVPGDRSKDEDCHYVTDTSDRPKSLGMMFQAPFSMAFPDLSYMALGDSDRGPLRPNWAYLVAWNRYRQPHLGWLLNRDTGFGHAVGFLHYYRYRYRYNDVKLDGRPAAWSTIQATFQASGEEIAADDGGRSQSDRYLLAEAAPEGFTLDWTMTRVEDRGKEERAWLVFDVNPKNPAFRRSFCLNNHLAEVGRRYRFRLEVKGSEARLFRDGSLLSSKPTTYQDPPGRDWRSLVYDLPGLDEAAVPETSAAVWRDQPIANTGLLRNGCTLLPSSGLAVLRQKPGDFTADADATAAALSYGPYGGGHGHPDKLSIAVYAQGRQWIPHYGSMPYETSWKTQWTSHTVSHNTVVVDGTSQQPAGQQDRMWPVDTSQDRVIGMLERFDPEGRSVSAVCDTAYRGLALSRRVRLWEHCVVDRFQVVPNSKAPASSRQFDYLLHVDGSFVESSPRLPANAGSLGQRCGYQHLRRQASAMVGQTANLVFEAGSRRLRIWVLPQGRPVEVILAEGLTNSPTEKRPVVVLRQRAQDARFVTVLEPIDLQKPLDSGKLSHLDLKPEAPQKGMP